MTNNKPKVINLSINSKPMALHFTLNELQSSYTARKHNVINVAPDFAKKNLIKVASVLEVLRYLLGNKPIKINSGYRCLELNKLVGGVSNSRHMDGKAADFFISHASKDDVKKHLDDFKKVGLIRYWYEITPNNYHLDIY